MSVLLPISSETCVIRDTDRGHGRPLYVAPGQTATRWLHYGRIILGAGDAPVSFASDGQETSLVCLKGRADVETPDGRWTLTPYDALYVPRSRPIVVAAGPEGCDIAECSAPVDQVYPSRFVSFADVRNDPGLHFQTGGTSSSRDLNILIGKNVEAGRLLAGVTFSEPGNWTSWPPHEHGVLAEEVYVYIDMPAPAFGVQLVYSNPDEPELATIVHEGDCVVMPQGYHPNVAAPDRRIGFLWIMAAHREGVDRQFGVVNVQPGFGGASGLETGQAASR
jgi:5-deoxy-glucuronate isomerase